MSKITAAILGFILGIVFTLISMGIPIYQEIERLNQTINEYSELVANYDNYIRILIDETNDTDVLNKAKEAIMEGFND